MIIVGLGLDVTFMKRRAATSIFMAKKKTSALKKEIVKPFNGGQWSTARMRSFIMSALRQSSMRWGPKFKTINSCYVRDGVSDTGHKCKLHKCPVCEQLKKKGDIKADHINPVIPIEWTENVNEFLGYNWNVVLRNLFCEREGFQPICKDCHQIKSNNENANRKKSINDSE